MLKLCTRVLSTFIPRFIVILTTLERHETQSYSLYAHNSKVYEYILENFSDFQKSLAKKLIHTSPSANN